MVKNLPANAGDTGLIPGPERSHMPQDNWAHASQLLSRHSRPRALQQEKPPRWEAHVLQLESSPSLLQQEKALGQQQRPIAAKSK